MKIMAASSKEPEAVEWNVDLELQLFYAMRGHKPVGVNRHFQMACIIEKFRNSTQKDVSSQNLWDHLDSMYDMAALHESEIIPFPNDDVDFALPDYFLADSTKKEVKKEEEKVIHTSTKSKETAREDKETVTPSGKQTPRERTKETKDDPEVTPVQSRKRKRIVEQQSSTPGSTVKRRRQP